MQLAPFKLSKIKNKNKNYFLFVRGMENCKMSGKNQGKSGNFEMNDKVATLNE